jgi:hypothetical protein
MPDLREDPIVTSSRREALVFLLIWTTALVYSVGYCYRHGYDRKLDASLDGMTFYFGWPDWVFWGVVVPWCVCVLLSIVVGSVVMRDAPLGEDVAENEGDL